MSTQIDLSRTSGLISLGTHTFQITDRTKEDMGPSGDPCWYIICKVISSGEDQGKELMHTISLGASSRFKMDEFLDGVGAPKKGKGNLAQFINKKFRASVTEGSYNGKPKSEFETIFPPSDSQMALEDIPSEIPVEDSALPADVVEDDEEPTEQTEKKTGRRF